MSKAAIERALQADGYEGVALYIGLCRLESDAPSKSKGCFFASATNIAYASGLGERTVKRHLPILERAGLFSLISGKKKGSKTGHQANQFTLLNVGPLCHADTTPCAAESDTKGPQKRSFSRREKETSSELKETGPAGASSADAGSPGQPVKKKLPIVVS